MEADDAEGSTVRDRRRGMTTRLKVAFIGTGIVAGAVLAILLGRH